jgi:signal transduction histidine kinase
VQGIRRLAGGVAHDLGNLLLVISGLSERALRRPSADTARHGDLEKIQRAATRAGELARDLLAVACKQALRPQGTDLNQALADAQERLQGIVGDRIELRIDLGADVPSVFFDPGQLERVFLKLAENARHRMPDGGRWVLTTELHTAREPACRPGAAPRLTRYAMLRVEDTATGIATVSEPRILEPYFCPGEGPGLGLALAVVEGIVAQSGGRVRVRGAGAAECGALEVLLPPVDPARSGGDGPR